MLGKSVILIHFFIEFLIVSTVILDVDEWAIDIRWNFIIPAENFRQPGWWTIYENEGD